MLNGPRDLGAGIKKPLPHRTGQPLIGAFKKNGGDGATHAPDRPTAHPR
jgi:hypothetical protein